MNTQVFTWMKWLVTVLLPLGIQLIPASEAFPAPMREFLVSTIFVILLAAFELLPNMLVGLLLPVAYVIVFVYVIVFWALSRRVMARAPL